MKSSNFSFYFWEFFILRAKIVIRNPQKPAQSCLPLSQMRPILVGVGGRAGFSICCENDRRYDAHISVLLSTVRSRGTHHDHDIIKVADAAVITLTTTLRIPHPPRIGQGNRGLLPANWLCRIIDCVRTFSHHQPCLNQCFPKNALIPLNKPLMLHASPAFN